MWAARWRGARWRGGRREARAARRHVADDDDVVDDDDDDDGCGRGRAAWTARARDDEFRVLFHAGRFVVGGGGRWRDVDVADADAYDADARDEDA